MAFDFSVTGNTKLDTSGFTQGVSSMTVAAGTLIADLVKTASSQLTNLAQSAIRNGSVYETSLAKVGTIADLGKLSIQKLGSQITDMSNTMGIAATDIAELPTRPSAPGRTRPTLWNLQARQRNWQPPVLPPRPPPWIS